MNIKWVSCLMFTVIGIFIFSSISLKINKYENNYLFNDLDGYSRIYIKQKSFEKMNIKEGRLFNYLEGKKNKTMKVISIQKNKDTYRVLLNREDKLSDNQINQISYSIGTNNYWNNFIGN